LVIAFSAALPLFMIHREIALNRMTPADSEEVGPSGAISVLIVLAIALAYSAGASLGLH